MSPGRSETPRETGTSAPGTVRADRRRWVVLVVGFLARTAGCTFQYGLPYALPAARRAGSA